MSDILKMAQSFEQNSKQQAENTQQVVSNEFSKLNKFINTEVLKSASVTKNAIQELQSQQIQTYKKTRLALKTTVILAAFLGGMYTQVKYQTIEVQPNLVTIEHQGEQWFKCEDTAKNDKEQVFCLPVMENNLLNLKKLWSE
jgi:predicted DNA repair protein MutK